MLYGKMFTIINFYLPHYEQIKSGVKTFLDAMDKAEGKLIMGGHFNWIMDAKIDDTTHSYRKNSQ